MNPTMNAIDIVVSDIEAAIGFYARLGLDFQIDANMPDHAGCDLPNGVHLMLDTEDLRARTTSGWTRPAAGPRTFLAFAFGSPAGVDAKYAELIRAGHQGLNEPWDAFWACGTRP